MAVKFGKTEVTRMAKVLDPGYAELSEEQKAELAVVAEAALTEAVAIVEARAKFTVVGQLKSTPFRGWESKEEADAAKVCLGFYSTAGDAKKAAEGLTYSTASHEEWAVWVLDVEHGTPTEVHSKRKAKREAALDKAARDRYKMAVPEWEKVTVQAMREWQDSLSKEEKAALDARIKAAEEVAGCR